MSLFVVFTVKTSRCACFICIWRSNAARRWFVFQRCRLQRKQLAGSTDCDQRNRLLVLIADCPRGIWIQHRFAIDEKYVLMITVSKLEAYRPATINPPLHWVGGGLSLIEAHDQAYLLGVRSVTEKINVMEVWPRGTMRIRRSPAGIIRGDIHAYALISIVPFYLAECGRWLLTIRVGQGACRTRFAIGSASKKRCAPWKNSGDIIIRSACSALAALVTCGQFGASRQTKTARNSSKPIPVIFVISCCNSRGAGSGPSGPAQTNREILLPTCSANQCAHSKALFDDSRELMGTRMLCILNSLEFAVAAEFIAAM